MCSNIDPAQEKKKRCHEYKQNSNYSLGENITNTLEHYISRIYKQRLQSNIFNVDNSVANIGAKCQNRHINKVDIQK